MNVCGLQKLTLLDYPGKVACTIFTCGCNFRCPFCHNADLVLPGRSPEKIETDKLFSFLKKRSSILDGVCISGGEPLIQLDVRPFLAEVKSLGYSIKLDTNGSFPDRLQELVQANLVDYVAMDIKNSPARYAETIGIPNFDLTPVKESVLYLLSGAVPYEFRTTVVTKFHSEEDFLQIGTWIKGASQYYLQAFIDSGDVLEDGLSGYEKGDLERFATLLKENVPHTKIRGI